MCVIAECKGSSSRRTNRPEMTWARCSFALAELCILDGMQLCVLSLSSAMHADS